MYGNNMMKYFITNVNVDRVNQLLFNGEKISRLFDPKDVYYQKLLSVRTQRSVTLRRGRFPSDPKSQNRLTRTKLSQNFEDRRLFSTSTHSK